MNSSIKYSALLLSTFWIQIWVYALGLFFTGLHFFANYNTLNYGLFFFISGVVLFGLTVFGKMRQKEVNNYASSVHKTHIKQFFSKSDLHKEEPALLSEVLHRTSFNRMNVLYPFQNFLQAFTIIFIVIVSLSFIHITLGPIILFSIAGGLFVIYLTDRLFGLRSYLHFSSSRRYPDEKNQKQIQNIVNEFSEKLDLSDTPKIIYSENEHFIAGATNPIFRKPTVYVSTRLLTKDPHIQKGLLAHEVAHLQLADEQIIDHRHIQLMYPIIIGLFAMSTVSLLTIGLLASSLILTSIVVKRLQHKDEYHSDNLALNITNKHSFVLSLLEFIDYNPFVERPPKIIRILSEFSSTHPPTSKRIYRALEKSG